MLRGIWLLCPLTYPGHKYADVSKRFLAIQASTIRCLKFPAAIKCPIMTKQYKYQRIQLK
ncbi:hypothetical protein HanRHA438_Chr10g0437281 [Helianthus annuus]|nr:hypothetical protein HanRHA438_Chr10g0437281 [Helianthus annuus]